MLGAQKILYLVILGDKLTLVVQLGQQFGISAEGHLVVPVSTRLLLDFVAPLLPKLVRYLVQIVGLMYRGLMEHVMGPLLVLRNQVS